MYGCCVVVIFVIVFNVAYVVVTPSLLIIVSLLILLWILLRLFYCFSATPLLPTPPAPAAILAAADGTNNIQLLSLLLPTRHQNRPTEIVVLFQASTTIFVICSLKVHTMIASRHRFHAGMSDDAASQRLYP